MSDTIWTRETIEIALAECICRIVTVDDIGVDTNFLTIDGKHFSDAQELINDINGMFHLELPVKTLFEHTTIRRLAERVYRSLLRSERLPLPPISIVSKSQRMFPLSHVQDECWFRYQQSDNDDTARRYTIGVTAPVASQLHSERRASVVAHWRWQYIVQRQALLRSIFLLHQELPVQTPISTTGAYFCPHAALRERTNRRYTGVPLETGRIPLTLTFNRRADTQTELALEVQEIVIDSVTLQRLLQQTLDVDQQQLEWPQTEKGPQYVDFARWQKQYNTVEVLQQRLLQWHQMLADVQEVQLTPDRAVDGTYLRRIQILDEPRLSQMSDLCETQLKCELKYLLLAIFYGQLSSMIEAETIAIATTTYTELEQIGNLENLLIVPLSKSERRFPELIEYVQSRWIKAAEIEVPSQVLAQYLVESKVEDASEEKFRKIYFSCTQTQGNAVVQKSLPDFVEYALEVEQFDTHLQMVFSATSWFSETLERISQQFLKYCHLVLAKNYNRPFSSLPSRETKLLVSFGGEKRQDFPTTDKCWGQLIQEAISINPIGTGLSNSENLLSFAEIRQHGNQIASIIKQRHIAQTGGNFNANTLIGLLGDETGEAYCALLGSMFAGGAYVPISTLDPAVRKQHIVKDASISTVLATTQDDDISEEKMLYIHQLPNIAYNRSSRRNIATPADLAYLIYTSGTTGLPKGVCIQQRAPIRTTLNSLENTHLQGNLTQSTRFTFDPSITQIMSALLTTSTTVLPTDKMNVAESVKRRRLISYYESTPTALLALGEQSIQLAAKVENLIVGGEAAPQSLLERFANCGICCWNGYGPAECTDQVTMHNVRCSDLATSIGKPTTECCAYLVNPTKDTRVSIGQFGECVFAGECLSIGYLNLPANNRRSFQPNPFQSRAQALRRRLGRIYRTGDRMKWFPDGQLSFSGRIDQQIKLRGYRIELEEIESILRQHPSINNAAVLVRKDASGRPQNLAAVYSATKTAVDEEEEKLNSNIRTWLSASLAPFMLPAFYLRVDSIPISVTSGKMDKRRLQVQLEQHLQTMQANSSGDSDPRRLCSHLESAILMVWIDLFGADKGVRAYSNFFALGGNSMLTLKLRRLLSEKLKMEIKVADLFRYQTVRDFARFIADKTIGVESESPGSTSAQIQPRQRPGGRMGTLFCTHLLVGGAIFPYKMVFDQPDAWPGAVYGVEHPNTYDERMLHCPFEAEALVDLYWRDMQAVNAERPLALMGASMGGLIAYVINEKLPVDQQLLTIMVDCDPFIDAGSYQFPSVHGLYHAIMKYIPNVDKPTLKQLVTNGYELWVIFNTYYKKELVRVDYPLFHFLAADHHKEQWPADHDHGAYTAELRQRWNQIARTRVSYDWLPGVHHDLWTRNFSQKLAIKTSAIMAELATISQ